MAGRVWAFTACLVLGGCAAQRAPVIPVPKPIIETRVDTIVRVERVPVWLPETNYECPVDPVLPLFPSPEQLGVYIADITQVADACRAKLDVLRGQR